VSNTELMSKTGRASGLDTQGTTPRNQAPQRQRMGCAGTRTRKKIKSLLTRPTSLEMLKNSLTRNLQKLDHGNGRTARTLIPLQWSAVSASAMLVYIARILLRRFSSTNARSRSFIPVSAMRRCAF
jgi:hypothetical protein